MKRPVVLGIDGGGSKTLVAVADASGEIAGLSRGAGINPLGNGNWRAELTALLNPLPGDHEVVAVVAGLPAHGEVEEISEAQRRTIAAIFGEAPQQVLNDVDAAQIGAFAGGSGILILSGTGSMAWARDAAGRSYRVGGWGDMIGDEGSGYWIGRRILGLVSQSLDGRADRAALADAMFETLGLDRERPADALEGWIARLENPRSRIAALAPLAAQLAAAGDTGAGAIIGDAAEELARHHRAVAKAVGTRLPWSYAGGTFASSELRAALSACLGEDPVAPRLPPIGGALLAAARLAGWPVGDAWIARLAAAIDGATAR